MASSICPLFLLQRCNFMIQLNPRVNNPAVGTFYVLLSAIFFSLGGFMIKIVPWQSLSVSGVRSIFALITLLLYMKLIHHPFRLNPSVIFGGICSASMSITFVCATKMTSAANAIILQFTHPVFLILILWLFYHKRPDKRAILTCIIALIGIVCFFFDKITSGTLGDWTITKEYLDYLDVLVDGPFVEEKKNLALRFRGSENQRLIDMPATLASGKVVLWEDWQAEGKGLKEWKK